MPDHPNGAVFLSYAREDAEAARRIADAMRAFGVEVWFDQHELRGGDAWDAKIRKQIRECALFVPIISANTQARAEGYFRREWKVAVDRTSDMAASRAFIMPVLIDEIPATAAEVPEEFLRYQWTTLLKGVASPEFVTQIKRLLEAPKPGRPADTPAASLPRHVPVAASVTPARRSRLPWIAIGVVAVAVVAIVALRPTPPAPVPANSSPSPKVASRAATAEPAPAASGKSIAVLPFANLSADPDNEFFADGVHEDVITSLAKIRDLKVISRTSVLAYRDTASRNLRKIAGELGVGAVLEGSVRRSGNRVRVTAQLIDARTDEHLWAETYDGELTDAFALQGNLAKQIASALKVNLTTGERTLIERKPTANQAAYDLYLRARAMGETSRQQSITSRATLETMVSLYERAIDVDPSFALAHVQLSLTNGNLFWFGWLDPTPARRDRARTAMEAAVRLAPDQPETRLARGGYLYTCENDWEAALREFRAAEAGMPNDAQVHYYVGLAQRRLGRMVEAADSLTRAVELNPRDENYAVQHWQCIQSLRRYDQARDLARVHLERFGRTAGAWNGLSAAQLELDGDVNAFLDRQADAPPVFEMDPSGQIRNYRQAMLRKDWNAAATALADPRLVVLQGSGGTINEPVALHRAYVAWLQGRTEEARTHALQAREWLRTQSWVRRQEPVAKMAIAFALALAGETQEAYAATRDGLAQTIAADKFDGEGYQRGAAARIYVILGRRDEALAALRQMFTGPAITGPWQIRIDPVMSRLKDDPRFEEILKLAKRL